jgi:hypothetical protein
MNVYSCGTVITNAELEVIEALILATLRGRCRVSSAPRVGGTFLCVGLENSPQIDVTNLFSGLLPAYISSNVYSGTIQPTGQQLTR